MIVNELRPQGYCGGVNRALKIVKDAILDPNIEKPLYILGYIINNKKVNSALNSLGIITFDLSIPYKQMIKQIKTGTAIITAHGIANNIIAELNNKNIPYLNATCPAIIKMHNQILNKLKTHEIIFIGKPVNHAEVMGVLGLSSDIVLISSVSEALNYQKRTSKPIFVANQTTLSFFEIKEIIEALKLKYDIHFNNNICFATTERQQAVISQPPADLLIVVGDKLSSNTNKLKEVSIKQANIKAILVEGVEDLNPISLKGFKTINVTSGASTPKNVTAEVITYLKQFNYEKKETWTMVSQLTPLDILE